MRAAAPVVRDGLRALAGYVPGSRPSAGQVTRTARLASNEAAFGPLPSVQAAMERELASPNRYPDAAATALISAIAERCGVASEQVAVGNGSTSLIRDLVTTMSGPGDEIVFADPSFPYYASAAIIAGATPVRVPLDANGHDVDAMLRAITDRTRVVFICNPNNPTGTVVSPEELTRFVQQVPADVLVVVDEAYVEFSGPDTDALELLASHPNVGVLRTFSKAYGLAGLRIGYFVGPADLVAFLRRVSVPFGVNTLAQAAAHASLAEPAHSELGARAAETIAQRNALIADLRASGAAVTDSHANFVFLPLGDRSAAFADACAALGILVRAVGGGARITIGTDEENARVRAVVAEWIAREQTT